MDATTNFLTAPAASPRGNDVLGGAGSADISPSGAQFAGVLNGHMLKLERQALASPPAEPADLQVLRLGNKLNVITTDAPLPDVASLADFARAQGLGEAAVQALFGAGGRALPGPGADIAFALPAAIAGANATAIAVASAQVAAGAVQLRAGELSQVSSAQAAMALAQSSAKDLLQMASAQEAVGAMAGQSWLNLRAQQAAATAISLGAQADGNQDADTEAAAVAAAAAQNAGQPAPDPQANGLAVPVAASVPIPAPDSSPVHASDAAAPPARQPVDTQTQLQALLAGQKSGLRSAKLMTDRAAASVRALATTALDAAQALAAAVQAGLGLAPAAAPAQDAVTVTSLSIDQAGSSPATAPLRTDAGAAALVAASAKALLSAGAATAALPADEELAAPTEAAPDLQIRLVPPDQAITRRLAQLAGQAKPMDWSALLAGQKVSDTLAGLAHSPAPALSDAQAQLVAQMQANGQLPASSDEGRNALLAKLQTQAATANAATAGLRLSADSAPGSAMAATGLPPPPVNGTAVPASQAVLASDNLPLDGKPPLAPAALALLAAGAAPSPQAARPSSLWESLRIEVPSGLLLEALKEQQAQKSDAEPTLPTNPSAANFTVNSPSHAAGADAAPATTPQALAEQRAAQYQQVADQLGEAMAKRLMAQIERGQWKMQLRMQPAALGRIDVELDMHAKGLDATFSSDNAVTRELMSQGSARLRDTLTQTGTTVASVVVNGDSGRQSGGNSTPGQKPKGEQNANGKKAAAQIQAPVAAMPPTASGDGLNVLA